MPQTTIDQLLFYLFVRIVDYDQAIGLRDIERLDQLIAKPAILDAPVLIPSLQNLGKHYQAYWTLYRDQKFAHSDHELPQLLNEVSLHSPEIAWPELAQGLEKFIQYFCAPRGLASKIRKPNSSAENRLAIAARLMNVLDAWQPDASTKIETPDIASNAAQLISEYQQNLAGFLKSKETGQQSLPIATKGAHRLVCIEVRDQNPLVKTFTFVKKDLAAWAFMPGQFLTFEIPMSEGIERRSYSISSSPYRPYAIEVTVKLLPHGRGSQWFHQYLVPGREITAHGPHGSFSILNANSQKKFAFFAAGVGITPLMSMLEFLIDSKQACDVVLVNRVHSHRDLIFTNQLLDIASSTNQSIHQITISSDSSGEWSSHLGLVSDPAAKSIDPQFIQKAIPDIGEREVFLCGPDSFRDTVLASLKFLNFNPEHFHSESFGGLNQQSHLLEGEHAHKVGAMVGSYLKHLNQDIAPEDECFVEFAKSGKTIRCAKGDLILEIAEFNGISIPNSCRMGSCGTCKCQLQEGAVSMDSEDGLTLGEIASGMVLACVTRTNSKKVVIDA